MICGVETTELHVREELRDVASRAHETRSLARRRWGFMTASEDLLPGGAQGVTFPPVCSRLSRRDSFFKR